jgi:hypothetical protein
MSDKVEEMGLAEIEALSEKLGANLSNDINKLAEKLNKKLKKYGLACQVQINIDRI